MKKGSGSGVCCLVWAVLRSHSKPFCFPRLWSDLKVSGAALPPLLQRVFSSDFHLSAFLSISLNTKSLNTLNQSVIRLWSLNSPSEYICKPCVSWSVLCNTNCVSLFCNHTFCLISFTSKGRVYLLEMTKQRASVGGSCMHVHSRTILWSHLNAESLGF